MTKFFYRSFFVFGILLLANKVSSAQSNEENPKFFATMDACIASGDFSKKECRSAFYNSQIQLKDRSPKFVSMQECRFRFQICELQTTDLSTQSETNENVEEDFNYIPVSLGVEIVRTNSGIYATSVLAVETPADLFPKFSLADGYDSDVLSNTGANAYSAIRPSDYFEPFPSLKNSMPVNKFAVKIDKSDKVSAISNRAGDLNDMKDNTADYDIQNRQISSSQSNSQYLD